MKPLISLTPQILVLTHHHHHHQETPDVVFALERRKSKELLTHSLSVEHALNTPTLDVLTLKVKTSLFLLNGYAPYVPLNHYRSPQSLMMTFCLLLMGVMQKPLISSKMYPPSASNPSLASFLVRILILMTSSVTLLNQNIIRLLSL